MTKDSLNAILANSGTRQLGRALTSVSTDGQTKMMQPFLLLQLPGLDLMASLRAVEWQPLLPLPTL
jgi:hypothetical protein